MRNSSAASLPPWKNSWRIACCMLLLGWSTALAGVKLSSTKPRSDPAEVEALKVVNDSDWAHTLRPTILDVPCTYRNPAFPGLYPEDKAVAIDTEAPVVPSDVVKPDGSEYLIRFQSVKPVQTAIQQLLALGEKWSAYGAGKREVSQTDGPTDLANARYNEGDMITIAVILKHPSPDGPSLFDYAFKEHGRIFPSDSFRVWPCAGLRTGNGQVFAHLVPEIGFRDRKTQALQLSFPRLIDGKLLISKVREKVEFRLVVNQRVFETTFYINAGDVLDGSETLLYLPSAFTDLEETTQRIAEE